MEIDPIDNELETIDLFDARINKRSQKILSRFYEGIGNSLPGALQSKKEMEAAYNFFSNDLINPDRILAPHVEKTIKRIKEHDFVLLIQDSSDIDLSHMEEVEGLGVLDDTKGPGCKFHSMIACTKDRLMLGVVEHKFMVREKNKIGKLAPNNSRKIEEKESHCWIEFYRKAQAIAKMSLNTKFVCVTDREGDIIELFAEADESVDLVVRSYQDRNVEENGVRKALSCAIAEAQIIGQTEFTLTPRKKKIPLSQAIKNRVKKRDQYVKKEKRLVKQNIRISSVTIQPPAHKKSVGEVNLQVIHLEEIDPPQGEDPICWTLLTTLQVDTLQKAQEVIDIYLARWTIEVFFYTLKEGCKIERLQLKTASSVFACVALYLIVAWRVMYVMFLGRNCPDLPCNLIFDDDEWRCVYATVKRNKPPDEPPRLGDFIIMLASLGGYIKRKDDPGPGPKIMWRALQMLVGCAIGWRAYREFGD